MMQRDRAVAIGLITNELLTNAAKHAFKGRNRGSILVRLEYRDELLALSVSDDGVGFPEKAREGALGQKLVRALCRQAGGTPVWYSDVSGTTFVLNLKSLRQNRHTTYANDGDCVPIDEPIQYFHTDGKTRH